MKEIQISEKTTEITCRAIEMMVTNRDEYEQVISFIRDIKALGKEIESTFDPIVQKAHAAWKETTTQRARFLKPLEDAEKTLKNKMAIWTTEQERIRREEERKIQAEREKAAAKEREKLAKKAEKTGDTEAAEEIRAQEIAVAPVKLEDTTKVTGISYTEVWQFSIEETSQIPREYLIPDEKKIGQVVRAMKGNITIPGIKIWSEKRPNVR